jgi:RNA polymerase sigma-70 factor, ECF subfamily
MADLRCDTDDQELFALWVREYGRIVRGFLLAMVRRPDVADDLCQEVFCRAWQARARYREEGNARAYLLRIADRLVCDRGRRAESNVNLGEDAWKQYEPVGRTTDPSRQAMLAEEYEQLTDAMEQLSTPQRRVLLLRYYGQFSFAEIADLIGCPLNTTLSHCRRGLETMRKLLAEKAI